MSLVLSSFGEALVLRSFIGQAPAASNNLLLRLFINNHLPSGMDNASAYREPAGYGYAPVVLERGRWLVQEGNPAQANYPPVPFRFEGPVGRVHGYFVTDGTLGNLLFAERFASGPFEITSRNGGEILIFPRLNCGGAA